jgi:acyl-CoA synthetase (NDP forming)
MNGLRSLFEPASIAVIGASATEGKAGYVVLRNLLDHGYQGALYPVNPRGGTILGLPTYPDLAAIPGPVEAAFVIVPAERATGAVQECAARGVRAAVIVSSGFSEAGPEGRRREGELRAVVRGSGMRCIGPNTVGYISMARRLVGSFVPYERWEDGPVAVAAQSGIFAGVLAEEWMHQATQRLGIRMSVSFGNKIDVDEAEFMEYAGDDPQVGVVALHLEAIQRPRELLAAAARVVPVKPVIAFKTGRSEMGARAAASHTGSLASNEVLVDAALRQAGIVRAATLDEFLALIKAFAYQPLPRGPRVGVITLSGAVGVMAADEMADVGLELARFAEATAARVAPLLPSWQTPANPLDFWMALAGGSRQSHAAVLNAVLGDPNTDAVLAVLLPYSGTAFPEVRETFAEATARHPEKPLFLTLFGGAVKAEWERALEGLRIPIFSGTALPVKALAAMLRYARRRGVAA